MVYGQGPDKTLGKLSAIKAHPMSVRIAVRYFIKFDKFLLTTDLSISKSSAAINHLACVQVH